MVIKSLNDFTNGWFLGDFEPTIHKTKDFECAVKRYKAGDYDEEHYHMVATEVTVIISGTVKMNNKQFCEGDIIVLSPKEKSDFTAITDALTAVVKIPSLLGDKYIVGGEKQNA